MVDRVADKRAEMPDFHPEGRTRNGYGMGATSATAPKEHSRLRASHLMEAVVERENMARAYRRVVRNGGAAGVDKMPVEELLPYLRQHWPGIKEDLLDGRYQPQPVRVVEIPKPGGGVRRLGIPTCLDRLIQQALGAYAGLRSRLLQVQLRLPPRSQRPPGRARRTRSRGAGPAVGRRPGSGEVL